MSTEFTYHTKATAPEASRPWLPDGFIPNLSAIMAESPTLLEGYKRLWELATGLRDFLGEEEEPEDGGASID